jgi:hypothetical protein
MTRLALLILSLMLLSLGALTGCPTEGVMDDDDAADDDDGADDDDSAADDDDAVDDDDSGPEMPPDPTPMTITFAGGVAEPIVFDLPTCTHYSDSEFNAFWRGADHNAVLMVQMLGGGYAGPGDYEVNGMAIRMKLQSEAGAPYDFFYQVETSLGDAGSVTIDHVGDGAWGSFSFTGMHSPADGQTITASPMPVPIWCPEVIL